MRTFLAQFRDKCKRFVVTTLDLQLRTFSKASLSRDQSLCTIAEDVPHLAGVKATFKPTLVLRQCGSFL